MGAGSGASSPFRQPQLSRLSKGVAWLKKLSQAEHQCRLCSSQLELASTATWQTRSVSYTAIPLQRMHNLQASTDSMSVEHSASCRDMVDLMRQACIARSHCLTYGLALMRMRVRNPAAASISG